MKYIPCLAFFISFNIYADVTSEETDKTCLKHALSVVNQLKTSSRHKLDSAELDTILRITTEDCKQHFSGQTGQAAVAKVQEQEKQEEDSGDWFTDKILNSDSSRKEGNKRLERMRRK